MKSLKRNHQEDPVFSWDLNLKNKWEHNDTIAWVLIFSFRERQYQRPSLSKPCRNSIQWTTSPFESR